MPVEIRRRTKLRRQWSMISAIVVSLPMLNLLTKTLTREARPYLAVLFGVSAHPPAIGIRRTTTTMATSKMERQSSHHHVAGVKFFNAAATAQDLLPVLCPGPQLALWPAPAKLPTSDALRAIASAIARTSGLHSRRRRRRHSEASSPLPTRLPPRRSQPCQPNNPPQHP